MTTSLFDRPASDWSAAELRAALPLITAARDRAAKAGDHHCASYLAELLALLADLRDARVRLARAVDEAACAVLVEFPEAL
jgi:hypothetical protein